MLCYFPCSSLINIVFCIINSVCKTRINPHSDDATNASDGALTFLLNLKHSFQKLMAVVALAVNKQLCVISQDTR